MGVVVSWVRNGRTGGRKASLRRRRRRRLGGRRKFILGRSLRKVLFRRKIGISTRNVGVVFGLVVAIGWVRNGGTGRRKASLRRRRKARRLGRRRRNFILGRSLRKVFWRRRKVGISTRKVSVVFGLVITIGWVRNRGTGGRKVGLRGRRRRLRRRRKFIFGRSLREVFFRRKVGISTRKVSVVFGLIVWLALARGVTVVTGRVRNGGTGGRIFSLRRRRKWGSGRGRKWGLGRRRNKVPLVRDRRSLRKREGSCKAGKNERRDDF